MKKSAGHTGHTDTPKGGVRPSGMFLAAGHSGRTCPACVRPECPGPAAPKGRRRPDELWPRSPNLRKRPPKPALGNGRVQRAVLRAFVASGAEVLSSSAIYDWTHSRRRRGRRKSMPFGIYSRTFRTLRAMCDPVERVPPYGAWLWRLREPIGSELGPNKPSAADKPLS
jgi:hypothetical protein